MLLKGIKLFRSLIMATCRLAWPLGNVDNAMGCGVHGIATVVDAGSSNVDYLVIASYTGLVLVQWSLYSS
jgi:hypothetical protein